MTSRQDEYSDGEHSFDRLTTFIERECNFATSHYNDSYLKRRFASRMRRRGITGYGEYLNALDGDPDEQQELLDALAINVTGFFRNPDVWEGVRSVLQTLSADRDTITVWSAGCADGREPYSVAMLARDDPRIDDETIGITATDINESALADARRGVYRDSRTIDIDDQLRFLSNYGRYIDRSDDTYRIRDDIKEMVLFEHHDLINDETKTGFDLVLCRNLFIYIDGEYKQPVLGTIRDSLRPGGYMVIGKAETVPPALRSEFTILDAELRIYRRE